LGKTLNTDIPVGKVPADLEEFKIKNFPKNL